jgi:hypothetical protein
MPVNLQQLLKSSYPAATRQIKIRVERNMNVQPANRLTGASRYSKVFSAICDAISAPKPMNLESS